ncbi:MAG: Rrf2 family transcriptional regulator [Candidatus Omnitrophica bacterium]|nr:Rrf2 family transcriptional regulator [Candidatus Omnitrophota bacterium]
MRITYKGDYALKIILDLARHFSNTPVNIRDIAKRADIPVKFSEQILLELKRGGFVQSKRGKIGGYRLSRPPSQIKLGDVVRFIDGPIEPIACLRRGYVGCNDIKVCVFRGIWQQVANSISKIIDNITFEELVKKADKIGSSITYQI